MQFDKSKYLHADSERVTVNLNGTGTLYIRRPTAGDVERVQKLPSQIRQMITLAIQTCENEDGSRAFTGSDYDALSSLPMERLEPLIEGLTVAMGATPDPLAESATTTSSDSS